MTPKPWAGFIADFPDDQVWGDTGQMEICGGRNVAVALGEILTALGCEISAPEYAGVKGWEFEIYYEQRHRFWCQVTSFHPAFYLLFEDPAITRGTRAKNAGAYAGLWRKLADALDKDPRFHEIEWRSKEEGPPDFDEVGEGEAGEGLGGVPPKPLDRQLRPKPTPRLRSGFGCLLMMAAACACFIGVFGTIGGVVRLIVWRNLDALMTFLVAVSVLCLGALSLWALMRKGARPRKV